VGGDAADIQPAAAVLDECQDVLPAQQDCVDVQEVDGEDPGGLRVQELPPGRAVAARRGIDARGTQELIDSGGRDLTPSLASSPVASDRVLLRQADGEPGDAADRRRPLGPASPACVVLLAASPRCQASSVAGVTGKTPAQRRLYHCNGICPVAAPRAAGLPLSLTELRTKR
jgi:hypothetical protein